MWSPAKGLDDGLMHMPDEIGPALATFFSLSSDKLPNSWLIQI